MLVLSAPVMAGTCSYAELAGTRYVCDGSILAARDADLPPPIDLTQVRADEEPASVTLTGTMGWAGDISRSGPDANDDVVANAAVWDADTVDDTTVVGEASAVQALVFDNSNDIAVSGYDRQYGIRQHDPYEDVTVVNSGDISVDSSGAGAPYSPGNHAFGIRASSSDGNVDVTNTGAITARASNDPDFDYAYTRGIVSLSHSGDASATNAGSIDATAEGADWALAFGIYNIASGFHESTVDNSGSINATAITDGDGEGQWAWAAGARATAIYPAYGAVAGYDDAVLLHNSGDITASASVEGNNGNAVAWGAYTMSLNSGGTSTLENDGTISSYAHAGFAEVGYTYAVGALATGRDTTAIVENHGQVDVVAHNEAADGLAFAIGAKAGYLRSGYGDATVTNDGEVEAHASGYAGRALSIGVSTGDFYSSRYGTIDNAGSVISTADIATSGIAYATGISGRSNNGADIVNSGDVSADATIVDGAGLAMGVYASSSAGGYTTVSNQGDISAVAVVTGTDAYNLGHASGIRAGGYDASSVTNAGLIDASAIAGTGDVTAYGAVSSSYHLAYLNNDADGIVEATADTLDGDALGVGAMASGWDAATLTNYGAISAHATTANGDAQAYAAVADGTYAGIALLINGGDLSAEASTGAGGTASATGGFAYGNVASVFNDANSSAIATADEGGTALASGARAYGEYTAVSNYGALAATASADAGIAVAKGADSFGYLGSSVYNAGDIQASASADGGAATAMGVYSLGVIFGGYTTNSGMIDAHASGDSADALGVLNAAMYLGDAITTNDGSINAIAEGGMAPYGEVEATAIGAYNFSQYYDSVVDNRGSISATALAVEDISGTDWFLQAKAIGAQVLAAYGYGETTIINTGDIHASAFTSQGYASAWGTVAQAGMYGSVAILNDNLITSYAHTDIGVGMAIGAYAASLGGSAQVVNNGDIVATASAERGIVNVTVNYADSTAVQVAGLYGGDAIVDNTGNIQANTSILGGIGYATGVAGYGTYMSINNAAGANITATVDAELFGGAFATAINATGIDRVDIVNDGTITAYGHANAYSEGLNGFYGAAGAGGIYASASLYGDVMVANNGDINAIAIAENSISWAQGGAGATGVNIYAKYDASIVNAGDINAIADAEFGNVAAYGAVARGKYSSNIVNEAGASIVASASVGSLQGDYSAGHAASFGTQIFKGGMEYAVTYNAGSIVSHATVTADGSEAWIGSIAQAWGSSVGYNSGIAHGEVVNVGSIEAAASADFGYATAYGAFVRTQNDSLITNAGAIVSMASAEGGNAFSVGGYTYSVDQNVTYNCDASGCDYSNPIIDVVGGSSLVDNTGDIIATADAQGGTGYSYGAVALGGVAAGITNSGSIIARTRADVALAVGALANSFEGGAQIVNNGDIAATATGTTASAIGVDVVGRYDDIHVDNAGAIFAAAYGSDASAVAVSMESGGNNLLANSGTIAALGDGERIAISSNATATAQLYNRGTVIGAIRTGDLDDSLDNAAGASWIAMGESDFGAGSNQIVNHGVIALNDATISLGGDNTGYASIAPFAIGNVFDNAGTLLVSGDANRVDMAGAAMTNNGVISFIDGAADDMLTVAGDFAGEGTINLDVSGLNEAGDRLYVDGAVLDGTAQALNINLVDVPGTAHSSVTLLSTSTPLAGDFALGGVQYAADGFLAIDFGLVQSANEVALEINVTGLNAMGSLASAIAPGVQSLVNAQVGTWRQRMGVVPESGPAGVAPWVRMFSDSGDVTPSHSTNFGTDGNFGFHQSNHGWELGLNTQLNAQLSVGALIASSDGRQNVSGAGSDRFDGRSFGLYATWLASNGFYLDVSHRWTGIEARLRSAAGIYETEASAQTWNVEAGMRAWSSAGGLNVVPQLQYSHTRVTDLETLSNGQADFVNADGVSSRARFGVAFEQSFQSGGFTWTPYGSINALHEFDGAYDHAINGGLQGRTSTEGTSAMIELGLGARRNGLSVTGGVNWTDGGALGSVTGAQMALRYSW